MNQPITLCGTIHYRLRTAVLDADDGTQYLLVIDDPPIGSINMQEVVGCHNFFKIIVGIPEGQHICVFGFQETLGGRPVFSVVRFPA